MDKTVISSPSVPPRPGYSHALRVGNLLFFAGQVARNARGELVGKADIVAQTRQAMDNLTALLRAAGAGWENVIKTNIYVTDMAAFRDATGQLRLSYSVPPYPASTLVEVKALAHPDLMVEIEAIAVLG